MDYQALAKLILNKVGGSKNVEQVTHCATRLRFVLKDAEKADTDGLKTTQGVVGVVDKGGQYQVIIGSDVQNVYRPLVEIGKLNDGSQTESGSDEQVSFGARLMATISGIFTPILPVITAAGMIKAVLSLLVVFKVVDPTDQNYQFLNFIGDAGFYFLPVFLGATAAKQFKTNTYLGMLMGAILLHPTFAQMVSAAKEANSSMALHFFGLPVTAASYSSTVIPIILAVLFMSYVERFADKISPKAIKFFSVPLITALVTSVVTFVVLGPAGAIVGQWLGDFFKWLEHFGSWVVPTVVGVLSPFLVMTGTHYGLVSIGINNRMTLGYDTVAQPGMLASNVAQGGAALAIAVKTKDENKRALASSAGITAVFGITEPALYGVTLQNKAALYATMISGGVAGFFLGLMNVRNFSGGSPGLLTIASYIGDNTLRYLYIALCGLVLSLVLSFVITYILYKEEDIVVDAPVQKTEKLYAPAKGQLVPLHEVKDELFSTGMLGKGVAILPEENIIKSPVVGEVESIFETKHAIGLRTADDMEILIHIGLDTVQLKGQYFKELIQVGQDVRVGTPLVEVDFEAVKAAGYDIVTPIIITNSANFEMIQAADAKSVESGDEILQVQ